MLYLLSLFLFPAYLLILLLKGRLKERVKASGRDQLIFAWACGLGPSLFWMNVGHPRPNWDIQSFFLALLFLIPLTWQWMEAQKDTVTSEDGHSWTKKGENERGDTYYVDFERIEERDGYVYYWVLRNLLRKDEFGVASYVTYNQGDCNRLRTKDLVFEAYIRPMGKGSVRVDNEPAENWGYPSRNSITEAILKAVCDHVESKKDTVTNEDGPGCSQGSEELYDQKEIQDMFQMRAGWRDLPAILLRVLSEKFESLQQAKEFATLCEDNGILTDNIKNVAKFARGNERSEAEWVVNIMLTNTLVSFSNRMGQLHEVGKMREGLGYVLRLNPNYIPAWHSMAALNFGVNNCGEAIKWASKVLNWEPSSSPDRFEKVVVESMNSDAWKQMQETMKMILKECSK